MNAYPMMKLGIGKRHASILLILLLATLAVAGSAAAAENATWTVTKTADPADGICDADCSLREAIAAADNNAGADTILFRIPAADSNCSAYNVCTIVLGDTLPELTDSSGATTIDGSGAAIAVSGDDQHVISTVEPDAALTLRSLTLRNGDGSSGGALFNSGTLIVEDCIFTDNTGLFAGAIYAEEGTLTVRRTTFENNSADFGGGAIINDNGILIVEQSTFLANTVNSGDGGAVYSEGSSTVTDSTFAGNGADNGGAWFSQDGAVQFANSTFSGNTAATAGGALYTTGGTAVHATFYGNGAPSGGAIMEEDALAAFTLTNSVLAGSTAGGNCATVSSGAIVDGGANFGDDASCGTSGDNNDPLLDTFLTDGGGLMPTHLLQVTSPAISAASGASCPARDQRGVQRPLGAGCDSGAVEYTGLATASGLVALQGRTSGPLTPGTVMLVDDSGVMPPQTVPFSGTDGAFAFTTILVRPGGSTYQVMADHGLYLSNELADQAFSNGQNTTWPDTTLRGGDANNDGEVGLFDLSCIGGAYNAFAPNVSDCGGQGSSDINGDLNTDIGDLSITGGNYLLTGPLPWAAP